MKSHLKKISVLFFATILLTLFACKTTSPNKQNQAPTEQDAKALKESVQQMNSSIQPAAVIADVVEGPVPPEDKNIMMYYYVQSGDNLAKIAKKIYGTKLAWKKLATINNIKNPNQIYAGDLIRYELEKTSKSFADAYENAPRGKIIIKKGDTLSHVAKAVFGHVGDWRVLWKENPQLKNPDKIAVGEEIYFRPKALKMPEMTNVQGEDQQKESTIATAAQIPEQTETKKEQTQAPTLDTAQ